jgi:hypothetical protein
MFFGNHWRHTSIGEDMLKKKKRYQLKTQPGGGFLDVVVKQSQDLSPNGDGLIEPIHADSGDSLLLGLPH